MTVAAIAREAEPNGVAAFPGRVPGGVEARCDAGECCLGC